MRNIKNIFSLTILTFSCLFLAECKSSSCSDIKGYYSGNLQMGYTDGTASLRINNGCSFTFTQNVPSYGSTTQDGNISKSGSHYQFNWDDGSDYDINMRGNNIEISGYNWSADLYK